MRCNFGERSGTELIKIVHNVAEEDEDKTFTLTKAKLLLGEKVFEVIFCTPLEKVGS